MNECERGFKVEVAVIKEICTNLIERIMADDEEFLDSNVKSNMKRCFLFKDRTYDEAKNFVLSDDNFRISRNIRKNRAGLSQANELLNLTKVVNGEFVHLTLEYIVFLGKHC